MQNHIINSNIECLYNLRIFLLRVILCNIIETRLSDTLIWLSFVIKANLRRSLKARRVKWKNATLEHCVT